MGCISQVSMIVIDIKKIFILKRQRRSLFPHVETCGNFLIQPELYLHSGKIHKNFLKIPRKLLKPFHHSRRLMFEENKIRLLYNRVAI